MSISAEFSLTEAIYAHVQQDLNVQGALGLPVRLYDELPPHPQFPFASFGRHQSKPIDDDPSGLIEQTLSLHIWSKYSGKSEAQEALHVFRGALQSIPSTMRDHTLVGLRIVFSDVLRAKDGRVFQAILRIRALTQASI